MTDKIESARSGKQRIEDILRQMTVEDEFERLRSGIEGLEEMLRQLEMPVDFSQLCKDGVLEKTRETATGGTFQIIDRKRLPRHAALCLDISITTKTSAKKGALSQTVTKSIGKTRNIAALKKKLLRSKKLLERMLITLEQLKGYKHG